MSDRLTPSATDSSPAQEITVIHVLRTGEPKCPKCGQGLESEGGSVVPAGSWDEGPLYWRCEDDDETWGFA